LCAVENQSVDKVLIELPESRLRTATIGAISYLVKSVCASHCKKNVNTRTTTSVRQITSLVSTIQSAIHNAEH